MKLSAPTLLYPDMANVARRRLLLRASLSTVAASLGDRRGRAAPVAAAGPGVYPTIVLQLRGGWDPVMTFDARPGLLNRDVTDANIRETRSGMRWNVETVSALQPHLEDAVLIRSLKTPGGHESGWANLWYGSYRYQASPGSYRPWPNHLASALLARQRATAPNVVGYFVGGTSDTDYVTFSNQSADPRGAAQRISSIPAFVGSLDASRGLPPAAVQQRVYRHVDAMNRRFLSPVVQSRLSRAFEQAGAQASDLLGADTPEFWPPDAAVRAAFAVSDADLAAVTSKGVPTFKAMVVLAFCLARARVSHVVTVGSDGNDFDTHRGNVVNQKKQAALFFPIVARLLSALKATPSPVEPGASMFDTTHVVVLTEMGRAPVVDKDASGDATGTAHWPWGNALLFGGRFKRGLVFGALDDGLVGVPADFATGERGKGPILQMGNLAATIMKANGVDPKEWSDAAPVDVLLRGSP